MKRFIVLTVMFIALLGLVFVPISMAGPVSGLEIVMPLNHAAYSIAGSGVALTASATDLVTLSGSATKTIAIKKIIVSGYNTSAAAALDVSINKNFATNENNAQCTANVAPFSCCTGSTTGTCGTLATTQPTKVQYDSSDPTPTATVALYSAAPTIATNAQCTAAATPWACCTGSTTGTCAAQLIEDRQLNAGAAGAAGLVEFNYSRGWDKPITLRGANQFIAINFAGGSSATTDKISYTIEWEEN